MGKTKEKLPTVPKKMGPPSTYEPRYCGMLVDHMKRGGSVESFGADIGKSVQTIYNWFDAHDDFREARLLGFSYLHKYYEDMGKAIAWGRTQRLKSEEPIIVDGKVVIDPTTGQAAMKREYEDTKSNSTAWIFLTKNMLGWRDAREISFDPNRPLTTRPAKELTPEEKLRELREAMKVLKEIDLDAEAIDIEITD